MLILMYFELNENLKPSEIVKAGQVITKIDWKGVADVDDYEILEWLVTPGGWGISLIETSSIKNIIGTAAMWREAVPGFFKTMKMEPAMKSEEAMVFWVQVAAKVNQAMK